MGELRIGSLENVRFQKDVKSNCSMKVTSQDFHANRFHILLDVRIYWDN
jgi:hypothetical protein